MRKVRIRKYYIDCIETQQFLCDNESDILHLR